MDKRIENRKLMEGIKNTLLKEGADKRYYQKHVDKIYDRLDELMYEMTTDEDISDVHKEWLTGHIDRAQTALEKVLKTIGKI